MRLKAAFNIDIRIEVYLSQYSIVTSFACFLNPYL